MLVAVVGCALLTVEGGCRAEQPWPLWQHYTARFLDASGRVIDHSAADRSTSEGQAYGMFFALVANDRASFDKMLRWTEDNLAGGDLTSHLPGWSWGRSNAGEWKQLDANPASDADLWLAYDCLEAGRLWKDPRLQKLGTILADRIAHSEVAITGSAGTVLLPGVQGFHPNGTTYILNPSYAPPQVLARLRLEQPSGPWLSLQTDLALLLSQGSPSGYAMDWVQAGATVSPSPSPVALATGKPDLPVVGSYDAIRVYLWFGMADRETLGVKEGLTSLPAMAVYLRTNMFPPLEVDRDGRVLKAEGTLGFSAAVVPYLQSLGRDIEARTQMDRLTAAMDPASGLVGHDGSYYDQNLALFSSGWKEGRFRFDREGRLKTRWK